MVWKTKNLKHFMLFNIKKKTKIGYYIKNINMGQKREQSVAMIYSTKPMQKNFNSKNDYGEERSLK